MENGPKISKNNLEESLGNLVDWLLYPAIITLVSAKSPNELKCLVASLYVLTPFAPFGVREIRERAGTKIRSLTKKG